MVNQNLINDFYESFPELYQERIDKCVEKLVKAKEEQQKVAVVTGSGPNIHEGVTTLIAELIHKGIIDGGVLTSSAVIAHEMAGALDKVKRVNVKENPIDFHGQGINLPRGDIFELTQMNDDELEQIRNEISLDDNLMEQLEKAEASEIIKAAGNMAYPMGLRTEKLAEEILKICQQDLDGKYSFEYVAGLGADPLTMIGAGALKDVPILVSIPQMVGGGCVGMSIGDSISIHERSLRNSKILGDSSIIIESGLALAQEIHDGPYETYTGHGIWSQWMGEEVYSLKEKTLIRFDLDKNLEKVWRQQRGDSLVQKAIDDGKPKTKVTGVPFRMEMSGFARLESSIPVIGDLGEIWPVIAFRVAKDLGIKLDFMSYKQETEEGKKMREFIVNAINFIDRKKMLEEVENLE